jgi:hypothetical protein
MCFSGDLCFVPHLYHICGTCGTFAYMYHTFVVHFPFTKRTFTWRFCPKRHTFVALLAFDLII